MKINEMKFARDKRAGHELEKLMSTLPFCIVGVYAKSKFEKTLLG